MKRPFPILLKVFLVAPPVMFVFAYVFPHSVFAPLLFVIPVVVGLIAVLVAIFYLVRREYRTAANVLLTLIGAIPPLLLGMFAGVFFFGHWHM